MLKIISYNLDNTTAYTILELTGSQFYEILRKIYQQFNFTTKIIRRRSCAIAPKDGSLTEEQRHYMELFLNIGTSSKITYMPHTVKGLYDSLQLKHFKNPDLQALSKFLNFLEISAINNDAWQFIRED